MVSSSLSCNELRIRFCVFAAVAPLIIYKGITCSLTVMAEEEAAALSIWTVACICGLLRLEHMELNEIRLMVAAISCLEKKLDLRLLLSSKKILASVSEDEKQSLNSLVNSAVMDSKVKGGLRWPLGKEFVSDRYIDVGVWHTKSRVYKSSFMRLKIRQADRFDFRTSTGDVAQEANLRIPELTSQLRDAAMELNPLIDTIRNTLKLVWENFL